MEELEVAGRQLGGWRWESLWNTGSLNLWSSKLQESPLKLVMTRFWSPDIAFPPSHHILGVQQSAPIYPCLQHFMVMWLWFMTVLLASGIYFGFPVNSAQSEQCVHFTILVFALRVSQTVIKLGQSHDNSFYSCHDLELWLPGSVIHKLRTTCILVHILDWMQRAFKFPINHDTDRWFWAGHWFLQYIWSQKVTMKIKWVIEMEFSREKQDELLSELVV